LPNRRVGMLALVGGFWVAPPACARAPSAKTHRIGILCPDSENLSFFVRALRDAGYEDGRNAQIVYRRWSASPDELDALAAELVAARVDVIAASSTFEIKAAKRATGTIPIVMMYGLAPVELGLVSSLAQPGGNVTGTVAVPREMVGKSIEFFLEAVPRLRRVAVLVDTNPWGKIYWFEAERIGRARGIASQLMEIANAEGLNSGFAELTRHPPDGLLVAATLAPHEREIIDFAASQRLPAMYGDIASVHNGGLMAYGPNLPLVYTRAAAIVDKIIRGARPQDIPVEEPTRLILAVNETTAAGLALKFPQSLLTRVDLTFR